MRLNTRRDYDEADRRWSDLYERHIRFQCKKSAESLSEAELTEMRIVEDALDDYEVREGLVSLDKDYKSLS